MLDSKPKHAINLSLLSRVLALANPIRKFLYLTALLAILLALLSVLRPKLVQVMVDEYIYVNDIAGLTKIAIVFIIVLISETILRYVFIYLSSWLGQSVIQDLRIRVFNHITNLNLKYFDKTPIGTSTTRTINDIETINTVFSQGAITIVADLITLVVVLGVMFSTSIQLTLISLTIMPFLVVASYIFKEKVRESYQKVRNQISKMNAFLQERISGMRTVQIFNAEEQERKKFRKINRDYTRANLDSILYYAVFFPVVEIISAVALGFMVWWGAKGVINQSVTLGALVAFPIYLGMLFRPIRLLADRFNTLQMGLVAAERVFKILDLDQTIENNGTLGPKSFKGKVKFDNVWFAYIGQNWVLKGLSFELKSGQTLAIVGSTGSGKSTIINLLTRFYEINKGQISIDNTSIERYNLNNLRTRIAVVLQEVFLFSGTVYENITLRNPDIKYETVVQAAKNIGAHEFIEKLPGGYQYQVQERGATLSMGQRQLISFVRALVFDPDILILDEATSSIDPETEHVIQYAIEKLITKRTSFIIAHRLSTIRNAHSILVLEDGKKLEFGSHDELIRNENGHYFNLYQTQLNTLKVTKP